MDMFKYPMCKHPLCYNNKKNYSFKIIAAIVSYTY